MCIKSINQIYLSFPHLHFLLPYACLPIPHFFPPCVYLPAPHFLLPRAFFPPLTCIAPCLTWEGCRDQTPTPTYCARVFRTCTRVDSKCARVFGISVATPAESHRLRRPSGFFLWFLSTALARLTVYNHPCLRDLQLTENF